MDECGIRPKCFRLKCFIELLYHILSWVKVRHILLASQELITQPLASLSQYLSASGEHSSILRLSQRGDRKVSVSSLHGWGGKWENRASLPYRSHFQLALMGLGGGPCLHGKEAPFPQLQPRAAAQAGLHHFLTHQKLWLGRKKTPFAMQTWPIPHQDPRLQSSEGLRGRGAPLVPN